MLHEQIRGSFAFSDFLVEPASRRVFRDGRAVDLTAKCTELLLAFLRRPGDVLTKDELIEAAWPPDAVPSDSTLTQHIAMLRRALGDKARAPEYIASVSSVGYRFLADVRNA